MSESAEEQDLRWSISRIAITSSTPHATPNPLAARSGEVQRSQRKTHKYGSGGSPLCQRCMAPVMEQWGPTVRYISTRA